MPSAHINKTHFCCRYKDNKAFTSEKINPVGNFESYLHDYLSCLGLELSGKTWQSIEVGSLQEEVSLCKQLSIKLAKEFKEKQCFFQCYLRVIDIVLISLWFPFSFSQINGSILAIN